uniref:Rhomboid-related protein 2 n=1 Tax=Pseudonaja textilis TaxID=8673 RepID=A0A670ZXL1_PSETE
MELERFNLQDAPGSWREEEPEEEEEEEESSRCQWIECSRVHNTVSKWMLTGEARATYLERASCIPPPVFILVISLAELSVFIYYAVWKPQTQWITLEVGIWESPLIYRPEKRKEAWRFLSYMFLHAGVEHIIGNLVLQLCLGIPLELVHKGHRVGAVYLAGVIGGSLASSICDPLLGLVGASGGVYALIGGYFMNILLNFREMIPLFGIARLLFIGLIAEIQLLKIYVCVFFPPKVSFVAHIAGGLAGMSVGYVIFSNFDKNFVKDPRFWICISAFLIFVILAVLFNVFFSPANQ